MKKSFILHVDSLGILDELTDEQAGQLFKLIYQYNNPDKPKITQITQMVNLVFYPFKTQFDRDFQTYDNIVERNKTNGLLGGRPKKKNPKKPKKPDSDSDSDSVNDNVIDNKEKSSIEIKLDEFYKFRKEMKKPVLESSKGLFIKSLNKLSGNNEIKAIEILEQSIANGWQGIFELKNKAETKKEADPNYNPYSAMKPKSDKEILAEIAETKRLKAQWKLEREAAQ